MFDLEVSKELIDYARRLVARCNFGRRGFADGNVDQQLTGLIAQAALHDLFDVKRPECRGSSDGGVDLHWWDMSLDIKAMNRTVRPRLHYANNFQAVQRDFPTDVLVFASFNRFTSVLTVCGWILKEEFLAAARLWPQGSRVTRDDGSSFTTRHHLYEIPNAALNRPCSDVDLMVDLAHAALDRPVVR